MSFEASAVEGAQPGTVFANQRYHLLEPVSDGIFFRSFRGRDTESGRFVLIKTLKPEFAADAAFAARVLSEAQSAATLNHPAISQIYEAWQERGTVVIAAEWVRGISLKERVRRVAPFPVAVAADIAVSIAGAIHYAHESGFCHGALQPENVIITPEGHVKVMDFGIGASLTASSRVQVSALPDMAGYLAPEVAQGRPPDTRSDLYALGCIMFEMLSGVTPYDADTPLAVAVRHLHDPVPSVRAMNPQVQPAVDGVVTRCLQKDPLSRYITAEALLRDLHTVQEGVRRQDPLNWSPMAPLREATPVQSRSTPRVPRRYREPDAVVDGGPSIGWIIALFVLILAVLAGGFAFGVMITRTPNELTVPRELEGMTRSAAETTLERLELKADVVEDYHPKVPAGKVFKTNPRTGSDIKAGKKVVLYVSMGPEPVTIPQVVAKSVEDARKELQALGLSLELAPAEFNAVIPKGQVISQSPPGERKAPKGSTVKVVLSKGPEPDPVPRAVTVEPTPLQDPLLPTAADPGADSNSGASRAQDLPVHEHEVTFPIPAGSSGPQHVKIEVRHEDGTRETVYNENHYVGDQIYQIVSTRGQKGKCRIRVYLNERIIKDESV